MPTARDRRCKGRGDDTPSRCMVAEASGKPIRVLLVEDDSCAAAAIEHDFSRSALSVTVARTLADARASLLHSTHPFDVVILELRLPDGRGESLLPDIEACSRQPAVIIYSSFLSELRADALEYRPVAVAKPVSTALLLRTVRTVVHGYARSVIERFVRRFSLSKRETEAIVLVTQGLKAKEIAARMICSEKTVYAHLTRACEKAGCRDYHEVVGRLFAFTCQALGHTPPDHAAFTGPVHPSSMRR